MRRFSGEAWKVADGQPSRDVFSWTKLMSGFNSQGDWKGSLQRFFEMQQAGVAADKVALLTALKACTKRGELVHGRLIHRLTVESGYQSDVFVGNLLLNMYNKLSSLEEAQAVFRNMQDKDVVSWTLMVAAFAQSGQMQAAFELFEEMRSQSLAPSRVTFLSLLGGCAGPSALSDGTRIHERIKESGLEDDIAIGTSLVTMYGKCGNVEEARKMFDRMKVKDRVVWNSMLGAYCQHGRFGEALRVFQDMNQEGQEPDTVTFITVLTACATPDNLNLGKLIHACAVEAGFGTCSDVGIALINMYGKCQSLEDSCSIFSTMSKEDPAMWNPLLSAFSQADDMEKAYNLFEEMLLQGVPPDKITFITMINACARPDGLTRGSTVHGYAAESKFHADVFLANAVLNMYSKCGSLVAARQWFDRMQGPELVSWNIMISAHCDSQGTGQEAIRLFRRMLLQGESPDEVHSHVAEAGYETNVSVGIALVNLYGKSGTLQDMKTVFDKMPKQHPVSWTAIISAQALHGRLKDALRFFQRMLLEGISPDKVTLTTVLGVCGGLASLAESIRIHSQVVEAGVQWDNTVANAIVAMYSKCGNLVQARRTFDQLVHRDLVSWNTMVASYTHNGLTDQVLKMFSKLQQEGMKPDKLTFISVLAACSQAGLVDRAFEYYVAMSREHNLPPNVEHNSCIIDLLGRLGRLGDAEEFISRLPAPREPVLWITLLGACRVHGSADRGQLAAERAMERDPHNSAPYVVLSNIYSAAGRWDDVAKLRKLMKERRVTGQQEAGGTRSWIDVAGKLQEFVAGDASHPRGPQIHSKLQELEELMMNSSGRREYVWPGSSTSSSAKLAVAFGVISTPESSSLKVSTSSRLDEHSHAFIRLVSRHTSRTINLSDGYRLHKFRDGLCSCKDYW